MIAVSVIVAGMLVDLDSEVVCLPDLFDQVVGTVLVEVIQFSIKGLIMFSIPAAAHTYKQNVCQDHVMFSFFMVCKALNYELAIFQANTYLLM